MKNPNTRIKMIAGVTGAIALVIALGASGAIAASRALSGDDDQAVIDDAADQLGVEPSQLSDALRQALENRIDRAVEQGALTEEHAERLKDALEAGTLPLFGGLGHKGFGNRGFGLGPERGRFGGLDAAASYLGITEDELRSELADGKTLAEVAEAESKSVDGLVDAMVEDAGARIDQAVADGKLTEEQASAAKKALEERVTSLVNGERPERGLGRGLAPGHWGSFGFRDGPSGADEPAPPGA